MNKRRLIATISILLIVPAIAFGHSGRTDSKGGHTNHSTGQYHYHHGYPAHQHTNGKCPYATTKPTTKPSRPYATLRPTSKPNATPVPTIRKTEAPKPAPTPKKKPSKGDPVQNNPQRDLAIAGGAVATAGLIGLIRRKKK